MTPLRQRMLEELQRRNYTTDTIRGYLLAVEQFARYFRKSPELLGAEEIAQFQLHLLREQKLAVGTIALRMGALRFLYKKTLKRRDLDFDDLPLLKKPKKLPVVLSPEEVTRLSHQILAAGDCVFSLETSPACSPFMGSLSVAYRARQLSAAVRALLVRSACSQSEPRHGLRTLVPS